MISTQSLRQRAAAARERLRAIPATGRGEYGAPDPETGERWNRGNVLGHLAEMLAFWTDQSRAAVGGQTTVGRGEPGYAKRREGIERGDVVEEPALRASIEGSLGDLDRLLSEMRPDELAIALVYRRKDGDRNLTLGEFIDQFLVGHLEEHLVQLEELT
ncbi:MAG TPA: hypothetical protein VIO84_06295 [Candidatus Dormibacteraeota bacterium]